LRVRAIEDPTTNLCGVRTLRCSILVQVVEEDRGGTGWPWFTWKRDVNADVMLCTRNGQRYDVGTRSVRLSDAASDRPAGWCRLPGANVRDDGKVLGQAPRTAADVRLPEGILRRLRNGDGGSVPAAGLNCSLRTVRRSWTESSAFILSTNLSCRLWPIRAI